MILASKTHSALSPSTLNLEQKEARVPHNCPLVADTETHQDCFYHGWREKSTEANKLLVQKESRAGVAWAKKTTRPLVYTFNLQ